MKEYEIEKVTEGSSSYWICTHHSCKGSGKHFVKEASAKSHYTRTHVHSKHDHHTETEDEEEKIDSSKSKSQSVNNPEVLVEEAVKEVDDEMEVDPCTEVAEDIVQENDPLAVGDTIENVADEIPETQVNMDVPIQNTDMDVEDCQMIIEKNNDEDLQDSLSTSGKEAANVESPQEVIEFDQTEESTPDEPLISPEVDVEVEISASSSETVNNDGEQIKSGDENLENEKPIEQSIASLENKEIQTTECDLQVDQELLQLEKLKNELKMEIEALKKEELSISKEVGELSRYKSNIIAEKYLLSEEISNLQEIRNELMENVTKQECKKDEMVIDEIEKVQESLKLNQIVANSLESQLDEIKNENQSTNSKIESLNNTISELNAQNSEQENILRDSERKVEEALKEKLGLKEKLENIALQLSSIKQESEAITTQKAQLDECLAEKERQMADSVKDQIELIKQEVAEIQANREKDLEILEQLLSNKAAGDAEFERQMEMTTSLQNEINEYQKVAKQQEELRSRLFDEKETLIKTKQDKESEIKLLNKELSDIQLTFAEKERILNELKAQLETCSQPNYDVEISEYERLITQQKELHEGLQITLSEKIEQLSNIQEVVDSDKARLMELETLLEKKNQEISTLQNEIDSTTTKYESSLLALESGQSQLLSLQSNICEIQSQLEIIKSEKTKIQENILEMETQKQKFESSLEELHEMALTKSLAAQKVQGAIQLITAEINQYELDHTQAVEHKEAQESSLNTLKQNISSLQAEADQLALQKQEIDTKAELLKKLNQEMSLSNQKALVIDQEIEEKEKQLNDLMAALQPKLTRLEFVTNSFNQKSSVSATIQSDIDKMQSDIITLQFDIETKKLKLQAVTTEITEKSALDSKYSEDLQKLEKELKEMEENRNQKDSLVSEMKEILSAKELQVKELTEKYEAQQSELKSMNEEVEQKETQINQIQLQIEESRNKLMSIRIETAGQASTLESINEEIATGQSKLNDMLRQLEQKKIEKEELEAQILSKDAELKQVDHDAENQKPEIKEAAISGGPQRVDSSPVPPAGDNFESKENTLIPHARVHSDSKLPKRSIPLPKTRLAVRKAQDESKVLKKAKLNNE